MKRILLIGELNKTLQNLNECLAQDFQVQLCGPDLNMLSDMVKLIKPDLLMISQMGLGKEDIVILDWIKEKHREKPVVVIETSAVRHDLQDYEESLEHLRILPRPVLKSNLLANCYSLLHMKYPEIVTEEVIVKEPKKILIVDDSPLLLRNLKRILEERYRVYVATSGEQALQFIPKRQPDLILLDYEMEGWDGRTTFQKIKEEESMKDIPVVFLTGTSDRERIYAVLQLNPAGYILKPPVQEKLFETIEQALKGQQNGCVQ